MNIVALGKCVLFCRSPINEWNFSGGGSTSVLAQDIRPPWGRKYGSGLKLSGKIVPRNRLKFTPQGAADSPVLELRNMKIIFTRQGSRLAWEVTSTSKSKWDGEPDYTKNTLKVKLDWHLYLIQNHSCECFMPCYLNKLFSISFDIRIADKHRNIFTANFLNLATTRH